MLHTILASECITYDYYDIIIIMKAKIIVTLYIKNVTGTLYTLHFT